MKTVAVFEAQQRFSELLAAANQDVQDQRERVSAAMARLRTLRHGASLGATLSEAIEDGRD
ncbi:MAG: hypothetical protein EPN23_11360 [Verrucomicrobia bacterium]|nr:MAG: hypothetical protein EPN23_11360 [Verrucomicrobiota bacterium]